MNHEGTKGEFDPMSNRLIGCALEVHRALGPGLLESAYEMCLARELSLAAIPFTMQVPLPVDYKGVRLDCGFRIDVLMDGLLLELTAVEQLMPVHDAQILTYMKLAKVRVGLLVNFNVSKLKNGIKRFVL